MPVFQPSRGAGAVRSGPIDNIFAIVASRPDVISFAIGSPATDLLPADLVTGLVERALAKYGPAVLQYGMTRGFEPLLTQARTLLLGRGIQCPPHGPYIMTGGSGALHNACMTLLDDGDIVLVETPTYVPATKAFRGHNATVIDVACDEFGMIPEALNAALTEYRVKFVYLLPTFQNPTGRTMPISRREQLAEVVLHHGALVVEDDVYVDLRYTGEPVPAFWSFAPENTLYLTSLSKTLAPAVRIGIAVAPVGLAESILALKQSIDMQTSTLCQAIAAEFLGGGHAAAHLKGLVATYSAKRDTLTEALAEHFPPGFRWTKPDGGLFVWVEGPRGFDADALLSRALERNVAYLPGSAFYVSDGEAHRNTMRLSFANVPDRDIHPGIERLANLCRSRA